MSERRLAAQDILDRTVIDAPVSGSVVNLQIHTNGDVISPGQPLMEIVPSGEKLVVQGVLRGGRAREPRDRTIDFLIRLATVAK